MAIKNIQYRKRRIANNEAARASRQRAKRRRRKPSWVISHPSLSASEREQVSAFLAGQNIALSDTARRLLGQHLRAARAYARDHYGELLDRLDSTA